MYENTSYCSTGSISLVTTAECSDSKVTEEESKMFLESQAPATPVVDNEPEETDDADDLVTILCCVCVCMYVQQ